MAYRSSSAAQGNTNSLAPNQPAGVAEGDVLVAVWNQGGAQDATITWPSGFSPLDAANSPLHFNTLKCAVKVATGSEPATYPISSGVSDLCVAHIVAFSGRSGTVVSVETVNETTTEQPVTVTLTGITAEAGDDVLWVASRAAGGGNNGTWTPPTNYTERQDTQNSVGYISLCSATRDNVSAGATGNLVGTLTGGDDAGFTGFVIRIAQAGSGSGHSEPVTHAEAVFQGQAIPLRYTAPLVNAQAVFQGQNVGASAGGSRVELASFAQATFEPQEIQFIFGVPGDQAEAVMEGQEISFHLRYSGTAAHATFEGQDITLRVGSSIIMDVVGGQAVFAPSNINLTSTGISITDDMVQDDRDMVRPMSFSLSDTDR